MKNENFSQASLIILAIIEILPNSIKEVIIDISIKSLYLDYFSAAETIESLISQKLIHSTINKGEVELTASGKPVHRLNLSPEGHSVLQALKFTMPKQILDFIHKLSDNTAKQKQLLAKYKMDANQAYLVTLGQITEQETIISLEITVPTEVLAKRICQHWKENYDYIYPKILQLLLEENIQ